VGSQRKIPLAGSLHPHLARLRRLNLPRQGLEWTGPSSVGIPLHSREPQTRIPSLVGGVRGGGSKWTLVYKD